MFTVLAPRPSSSLTVTGLDGDMAAETFHTSPAGSDPWACACVTARSRPRSATRKLRIPSSVARSTSSSA